jgi:hypothetical protein
MSDFSGSVKTRMVIACVGVVALLCVLSGRLVYIEVFRGEGLSAKARSHYEYKEELPAERGRIFDRSGELLARNQTCLFARGGLSSPSGYGVGMHRFGKVGKNDAASNSEALPSRRSFEPLPGIRR